MRDETPEAAVSADISAVGPTLTMSPAAASPAGAPTAAKEKTPLGAWWMLAVLLLFYILSFMDRYILTMLVDPIKADLGLSDLEMSLILGPAFAVCYGIFGVPLGWAADRYPRRWVIFLGVCFWSLATATTGFSKSFAMLFLTRMGVGVGEASLSPAAFSLMADRFPQHRLTLAISIYQTGVKIGSAAAFTIGAVAIAFATALGPYSLPLIGELAPWQMVMMMLGAPGVVLALLVFTFTEPPKKVVRTASGDTVAVTAFVKANLKLLSLMMVGFCLVSICAYSQASWVPTYFSREFGWKPTQYGPAISIVNLAAASSMLLKGWIVDWLYSRGMQDAHLRFYTWLLIAATPVGTIAFMVDNPILALLMYGILQVVAIQYIVYMAATIQIVVPAHMRARVTGAFMAALTIFGMGLGPTVVALLTDYVFADEQMLGWSLTITTAATLPLAWLILRSALGPVRTAMAETERTNV
jgi:MFS family permease